MIKIISNFQYKMWFLLSCSDLCTQQSGCGTFDCLTVARQSCCNCPMGDNYLSNSLGQQCTSKLESN